MTTELGLPQIIVHVLAPDGRPCEDAVITGPDASWGFAVEVSARWPAQPTVVVVPHRSTAHLDSYSGRHRSGRRTAPGEFTFPVEGGRGYRVGLMGPTNAWRPVDVDVTCTDSLEVVLTQGELKTRGMLSVYPPEGGAFAIAGRLGIRIEDAEEGTPLLFDEEFDEPFGPESFSLPEGRYRVVIEGCPFYIGWHGILSGRRSFGRFESTADVVRGQTHAVHASVIEGARIRLDLEGQVLEADLRAVAKPPVGMRCLESPEELAPRASVWLLADGHWPEAVQFENQLAYYRSYGPHIGGWLTIGTEQVSEVVPAGHFRLEARMPGGRVAATDVVLVDGQTMPVSLRFQ